MPEAHQHDLGMQEPERLIRVRIDRQMRHPGGIQQRNGWVARIKQYGESKAALFGAFRAGEPSKAFGGIIKE